METLFDSISQVNTSIECDKKQIKSKTESILKGHLNNQHCNFDRCISFLKKYQNYAKDNGNNIREIHILLGENNEYIDCSINNETGGNLTNKMLTYIKNNNSHLIHNHPSNGSLSTSDWKTLAAHLTLKMTAVNDFGSYFTGSVTRTLNCNDYKIFIKKLDHLDKIKNKLISEHGKFITSNLQKEVSYDIENQIANIETWLNHKLGSVLFKAGYSTYTHEIETGDNSAADKINDLNKFKFQAIISLINNW